MCRKQVMGPDSRLKTLVKLEPLDLSHANGLFKALNHEEIGIYIGGADVTSLSALEDRIKFLKQGPKADSNQLWVNFVVLLNSEIVGRVEATLHDSIAEIAYLINPLLWGQGLGTAAAELLIDELRGKGEYDFWATVTPENKASARVLEKLEFVEIDPGQAPQLLSYDSGDRTFRKKFHSLS
ncbi:MAG: GNAT family N-acetyltransferase [Candidatus Nanopelagicaceae bacterium]|nr:GNAT family N-acetyltransferase [Candidatus Nanopelagicaceae bacterium]